MEEGCGAIFIIAGVIIVAVAALAAIVYVVLPASGLILLGIAVAGLISGAFIAVRNFGVVLIEAHQHEK